MSRLTENDRHFGPITYARCNPSWRPLRVVLSSGADEDRAGTNNLTVYAFGWVARLTLPRLLDDYKVRHVATSWDAATVERLGRNWYEEHHAREYGFSLSDGFLQLFLGAQTHDSTTTQSWCAHLPWTQWRFHRFSLYDIDGAEFWTQIERPRKKGEGKDFYVQQEKTEKVDKAVFLVDDYDGQRLTVTTHIEEREWRFGDGWFKWLHLFRKPMVRRCLRINFDKECGPEKGSWKGGLCGTSIEMLPGELHEAAFRRYCDQEHRAKYNRYRITFVGVA